MENKCQVQIILKWVQSVYDQKLSKLKLKYTFFLRNYILNKHTCHGRKRKWRSNDAVAIVFLP